MEHNLKDTVNDGTQPVPPRAVPATLDVTREFEAMHELVAEKGAATMKKPPGLGDADGARKFIWTPGLFAAHKGNHSKHILKRVAEMGLDVLPVPVDTDVQTLENIELIKRHIRDCKVGEAILAGHSRGGIMNLDAYRQLSDADKAKVAKIIVIQSPVNGSPVADWVAASKLLRRLTAIATRVVFGKNALETVLELTTAGRKAVNRSLPPLTGEDLAKVVTLRSTIARGESTSFEIPRRIAEKAGHTSDGLTPYHLSEIEGAMSITLNSFDHENLVIQEPMFFKRLSGYRVHKKYHAGDVTEALLILAMVMSTNT